MRDPYLYDDVDVLKNRANIKDSNTLRKAEADITDLSEKIACADCRCLCSNQHLYIFTSEWYG